MESNRKPQWTPGPWEAEECSLGWTIYGRVDMRIARMFTPVACYGDSGEANARLIAAAPQMAEALRQLVDAIEDYIDDGSLPRDAESHETMRNARAVLARIDGEK